MSVPTSATGEINLEKSRQKQAIREIYEKDPDSVNTESSVKPEPPMAYNTPSGHRPVDSVWIKQQFDEVFRRFDKLDTTNAIILGRINDVEQLDRLILVKLERLIKELTQAASLNVKLGTPENK